jgi:hypothetical protein
MLLKRAMFAYRDCCMALYASRNTSASFVGCYIETRTLDNYNHIILIILVIMITTLYIVVHLPEYFTRRVQNPPVFLHHRVRLDVNSNIRLIVYGFSDHGAAIKSNRIVTTLILDILFTSSDLVEKTSLIT